MDALSDVRKPNARIGTRLEQIACCLDIGFRHMLCALDGVTFLHLHATLGVLRAIVMPVLLCLL